VNQNTIAANPEAGCSALRRAAAATDAYAPAMLNIGWIAFAVSMLGLGMLGFITGDFALNWQPVPAGGPGRTALAYVTAALFWTLGAGLLFDRFKYSFAIATAVAFLVWAIVLHGPGVVGDPLNVLPWLGFTERLQVAAKHFEAATFDLEQRVENIVRREQEGRAERAVAFFAFGLAGVEVIDPAIESARKARHARRQRF
jgi:hypothetical protein